MSDEREKSCGWEVALSVGCLAHTRGTLDSVSVTTKASRLVHFHMLAYWIFTAARSGVVSSFSAFTVGWHNGSAAKSACCSSSDGRWVSGTTGATRKHLYLQLQGLLLPCELLGYPHT